MYIEEGGVTEGVYGSGRGRMRQNGAVMPSPPRPARVHYAHMQNIPHSTTHTLPPPRRRRQHCSTTANTPAPPQLHHATRRPHLSHAHDVIHRQRDRVLRTPLAHLQQRLRDADLDAIVLVPRGGQQAVDEDLVGRRHRSEGARAPALAL